MRQRVYTGKPIVGWVPDDSLPRISRLVVEPHSREILAVDGYAQRVLSLDGEREWQVDGPPGGYVFGGVWHPDRGLFFAFGGSNGRGSWALLRVCGDGSVHDTGAPKDIAVMSLCYSGEGDLILGVASLEGHDGREVGGGIATFDIDGRRFRWLYRPPAGEHFVPSDICWDSDAIHFVHTSKHTLMRLDASGGLHCVGGRWGRPDADPHGLNSPTGLAISDGRYLVTDRGNHRVLLLDMNGNLLACVGGAADGVNLIDPRHALITEAGVYVADVGIRAVLEISANLYTIRRRWGGPEATGIVLSRPRSIDRAATGELVVADTNNDRIVGVDDRGGMRWQIRKVKGLDGRSEDLRWPRSARISDGGRLLVSDSLNSRVLVVDQNGLIEKEIRRIPVNGSSFSVSDPHDGRWIGEDEVLLVDSASAWVARVRCDGAAAWVLDDLRDPHQAEIFGEWVVVADPGLDALLLVDASSGNELWRRNEFLDAAGNRYRLFKPRVVRAADDYLLVVDADCQIVALGQDWLVRWNWNPDAGRTHGRTEAFGIPDAPRDLVVDAEDRILLSDYRRNCVVELRPRIERAT